MRWVYDSHARPKFGPLSMAGRMTGPTSRLWAPSFVVLVKNKLIKRMCADTYGTDADYIHLINLNHLGLWDFPLSTFYINNIPFFGPIAWGFQHGSSVLTSWSQWFPCPLTPQTISNRFFSTLVSSLGFLLESINLRIFFRGCWSLFLSSDKKNTKVLGTAWVSEV